MEERTVWMRLGVTLRGSAEEIERLFEDGEASAETLDKILKEGRYEVSGDSYIPEPEVESYNEEYGTSHEIAEYGFNL